MRNYQLLNKVCKEKTFTEKYTVDEILNTFNHGNIFIKKSKYIKFGIKPFSCDTYSHLKYGKTILDEFKKSNDKMLKYYSNEILEFYTDNDFFILRDEENKPLMEDEYKLCTICDSKIYSPMEINYEYILINYIRGTDNESAYAEISNRICAKCNKSYQRLKNKRYLSRGKG